MRLIGTLNERRARTELIASNRSLQDGSDSPGLLLALRRDEADPSRSYIIDHIPEQGEDIYAVMVPGQRVLTIEVPRDGGEPIVESESLVAYKKRIHKTLRLRIAIAEDLDRLRAAPPESPNGPPG